MKSDEALDRIAVLEQALRSAIEYLDRLPPVPVTVEKAGELRAVLDGAAKRERSRAKVGERIDNTGVPLVRCELIGDTVWVSTRTPESHEAELLSAMRQGGCSVQLKELSAYAPLTELEQEALGYPSPRTQWR